MRYGLVLASAMAVAGLTPVLGSFDGASGGAAAQAQLQGPAEMPPASYRAMQYIDSRGCAFVRAGSAGNVVWVPRVTRDRQQICGQPPSQQTGRVVAPTAPAPAPLPAADPTPAAEPARVATAPVTVEPPARPAAGAPIPTVASLTTPPALASLPAAPPAFPSLPAVAPAPQPEAPRPITLAEACQGRTGPLLGYVNAETRQPVTCGPAPVAIAMAPVAETVTAPVPAPAAAPARGITLAEACQGRSGVLEGYVSAATGQPVECPSLPRPQIAMAQLATANAAPQPVQVAVPAPVASAPCPPGVLGGVAYRCGGGQGALTLALAAPAQAPGETAPAQVALQGGGMTRHAQTHAPARSYLIDPAGPVPASNPPAASPVAGPPPGYVSVFDDGRLNTRRGPQGGQVVGAIAHEVVYAAPAQQHVPAAPVASHAPQAAAGHRFVQVGSFGQSANAERAAASLRAMGLPVTVTTNGRGLQNVAAGPFADRASLQNALQAARNAGFRDAYSR